ncbi:outer membrane beta-barrel protein [Flavobacterium crassostreae]|nr:outer membrane beta-barrel protein [Flavobacterium crassostreae]
MKKIILLLLLISSKTIFAQGDREITYGLFVGAIHSTMSNLPDVIVPKGVFKGYTLDTKGKFGTTAGFKINWKYPYAKVSVQTEVLYSNQGTDLNYKDNKGLIYKTNFGYSYLNFGAQFKFYPFEGFYIGLGPYVGFSLNSDNIHYSSNSAVVFGNSEANFEPDATVEKVLKESLTAKNFFYGTFATGYEFSNNLSIGARYNLGLTDGLTTEENGHRYKENANKINSISLVIGYSFNFDDLGNF